METYLKVLFLLIFIPHLGILSDLQIRYDILFSFLYKIIS